MGRLVSVLDKTGENAVKTAVDLIQAMDSDNSEAYGTASPALLRITKSLSTLRKTNIKSSTAVGYVFSKTLQKDMPQPTKINDAAIVFDGRLFQVEKSKPGAHIILEKSGTNLEQAAETFTKKANGDFAFAIAGTKRIVAARDVMGVRPLYYGENEKYAVVASERKALWSIGIENVDSFPPGCVCRIDKAGFKFTVARAISLPKPEPVTMQTAAHQLRKLLKHSVKERVSDLKEVAIAFSGGLDSSVIACLAKNINKNVVLVHVSLECQPETESAKLAAEELKLPLCCQFYTEKQMLASLPKVMSFIEDADPIQVSIGIPMYWAAEKTAEMGFHVMLAGQGADELFGGYKRYLDEYVEAGPEKPEKSMYKDVTQMYRQNLERDSKICSRLNIELRLPFATYEMARFALNLPLTLKMERANNTLRKLVLRQVAQDILLPMDIANKPKKAIQYTTGISKVLKKVAKQQRTTTFAYLQQTYQKTLNQLTAPTDQQPNH